MDSIAELLPVLSSVVVVDVVAVFWIIPLGVSASTRTVTLTDLLSLTAMVPSEHDKSGKLPVSQLESSEICVSCPGSVSDTSTFCASDGPAFETSMV